MTAAFGRPPSAEAPRSRPPAEPLLEVEGLTTEVDTPAGPLAVVRDVSFAIQAGETLGIVGETGSGKSVTALSVMGLLPEGARVTAGTVRLGGRDLAPLAPRERQALLGAELGMVYQDPMTSLNPLMRVGEQVAEGLRAHGASRADARRRALEAFAEVGLPNPERVARAWPHQLSGGMRQRVMIATALAGRPRLLVADEPTTALDVTVQQQIVALTQKLCAENGLAVLWITHDLGVVARLAQRVMVMYAGRCVETAPAAELFARPQHPYTAGLLAAIPPTRGQDRTPLAQIGGAPPDPASRPPGCAFQPRCPQRIDRCQTEDPPMTTRNHPAPASEGTPASGDAPASVGTAGTAGSAGTGPVPGSWDAPGSRGALASGDAPASGGAVAAACWVPPGWWAP